jgi:hypothetical protein
MAVHFLGDVVVGVSLLLGYYVFGNISLSMCYVLSTWWLSLDAQVRTNHPFLSRSHFPSFVLS